MNPDPPPRRAAIALVTPDGTPIGRLPEVPVATRWWPDVQAVVQIATATAQAPSAVTPHW